MSDALNNFDFNQTGGGSGLWLKFQTDEAVKMRVLTTDPIISLDNFGNTRFSFVIYNHEEGRAQIMSATQTVGKTLADVHKDADFGSNIQKVDIKITPVGAGKERRYDVKVLQSAVDLKPEQIKEASQINLIEEVKKGAKSFCFRMSEFDKAKFDSAKKEADEEQEPVQEDSAPTASEVDDEEINLDDIPF